MPTENTVPRLERRSTWLRKAVAEAPFHPGRREGRGSRNDGRLHDDRQAQRLGDHPPQPVQDRRAHRPEVVPERDAACRVKQSRRSTVPAEPGIEGRRSPASGTDVGIGLHRLWVAKTGRRLRTLIPGRAVVDSFRSAQAGDSPPGSVDRGCAAGAKHDNRSKTRKGLRWHFAVRLSR